MQRCMPDGKALVEVGDVVTLKPLYPGSHTPKRCEVVGQCQHHPHVVGARCGHHIIEPLHPQQPCSSPTEQLETLVVDLCQH